MGDKQNFLSLDSFVNKSEKPVFEKHIKMRKLIGNYLLFASRKLTLFQPLSLQIQFKRQAAAIMEFPAWGK